MKITSLMDNIVYDSGLMAEHGLSIFIEANDEKILFDTGQTGNFINNAHHLGIDIEGIDALVMSHGHYDHTGGLKAFCEMNQNARIFVKESFFVPKYKNKSKFIGTESLPSLYGRRINIIKEKTEIYPNIFIIPEIPIINAWDTHFNNFFVKQGKVFSEDTFTDEQFMVLIHQNKMNIISGCSHRGISNIIQSAVDIFHIPIQLVMGGFHLKNTDAAALGKLTDALLKHEIENIGACHCTGIEPYCRLKKTFKDNMFYHYTGHSIDL